MKKHNIDWLKRQAKNIKKQEGISHTESLNKIAQLYGFENWKELLNAQQS